MAIFVLSDTHLSLNSETEKPMDIFGSRWKNHADRIKELWNMTVSVNDTVVIPGDISWAMTLSEAREDFLFLHSLPGHKIISKGNHDYWWQTVSKAEEFFTENGIDSIDILHNNAFKVEDFIICGTRGWYSENAAPIGQDYKKIVSREAGRLERSLSAGKSLSGGEMLVFLHFPPALGDFVCREIIDIIHKFNVKRCWYGHMHGQYGIPRSFDFEGIQMNIASADYLQFRPLLIE